MKNSYKILGGTNMKLIQENYTSTGSVEPVRKSEDRHLNKHVKGKSKPGAHQPSFNHRDQSRDQGTQN